MITTLVMEMMKQSVRIHMPLMDLIILVVDVFQTLKFQTVLSSVTPISTKHVLLVMMEYQKV